MHSLLEHLLRCMQQVETPRWRRDAGVVFEERREILRRHSASLGEIDVHTELEQREQMVHILVVGKVRFSVTWVKGKRQNVFRPRNRKPLRMQIVRKSNLRANHRTGEAPSHPFIIRD